MKRSVKILKVLFVAIMAFMLTGCMKFNATMEITKNGKFNYTIIYAIDESFLEGKEILDDADKKEIESRGFKVEDYKEDTMKGIKIYANNLDINTYSSEKDDVSYELSNMMGTDGDAEEISKIFKVKKGFLKNTYTATFKFDNSSIPEMDNTDDTETSYSREEDDTTTDDEYSDWDMTDYSDDDYDTTDNTDDDFGISSDDSALLEQYMSNMDMKFTVKLPYKAISNNATSVNNDGKDLAWDLTKSKDFKNIEFAFTLYNTTNIIILVVVGVVIIGGVVFFIVNRKKKGKGETALVNNTVNEPVNNNPNGITTFPAVNTGVAVNATMDTSSKDEGVDTNTSVDSTESVSLKNIPGAKENIVNSDNVTSTVSKDEGATI